MSLPAKPVYTGDPTFASKDLSGEMVSPDEPGYNDLINAIWDTMRLADELNTGHHTPDEVRDFLSRITGREIDPSDCHRGQGLDRHRRHRPTRGANSVVTHDVPPMTVVGGNPARFIKEIKPKAK